MARSTKQLEANATTSRHNVIAENANCERLTPRVTRACQWFVVFDADGKVLKVDSARQQNDPDVSLIDG